MDSDCWMEDAKPYLWIIAVVSFSVMVWALSS